MHNFEQPQVPEIFAETLPVEWDMSEEAVKNLPETLQTLLNVKFGTIYGVIDSNNKRVLLGNIKTPTKTSGPMVQLYIKRSNNDARTPLSEKDDLVAIFEPDADYSINGVLGTAFDQAEENNFKDALLKRLRKSVLEIMNK